MSSMNHYEVLGISRTAGTGEIKAAYRRLVKQYHPDINPSEEARQKIREINEAFEVLSDYYTKNNYDALLNGTYEPVQQEPETPQEKYRREFLHKKVQQERKNIEQLIKVKIRFYRYQRYANMVFFLVGILFTLDYYITFKKANYVIAEISMNKYYTSVSVSTWNFKAEKSLFYEYEKVGGEFVQISFSSIFSLPSWVRLENGTKSHKVLDTLHSYRNVFAWIILVCSLIVIRNKEYTDFRLTCGIIPVLLVLFLLLFVVTR